MNTVIIPERRSSFDYTDNCYTRILPNNVIKYYNKEYYNSDFTRKSDDDNDLENIKKEILLFLIDDILE
jgi:hypothetical protein